MEAFLHWWLRQLAELLPSSLAAAAADGNDAVILAGEAEEIAVLIRRRGIVELAARVAANPSGFAEIARIIGARDDLPKLVLLRIPTPGILHKELSVPMAAQRDLEGLLGFEMDRETPFARDEVYWSYAVRRRDPGQGKLDVDLVIVPRSLVGPLTEAAQSAGLTPAAIEVQLAARDHMFVPLGTPSRWHWLRSQRSLVALATAACALAFLAVATPFIRQQWALAQADSAITSLTKEAEEAASLRQSVDQFAHTTDFLNKERQKTGGVLEALAAATRSLPDDTHLTALTLRGGRLSLTGQSSSAASLISLLAQSPSFREPAFDLPVLGSDGGDLETFTISVALAKAGTP